MTSQKEMEELLNALAVLNVHRYTADKRIYKYMSIDTAKKVLNGGTMKFSTAEQLKDYDLEMALLNFNLTPKMQEERLDKVCETLLKMGRHPDFIKARRKQIDCIEMMRDSYKALQRHVGFFCATTSNTNSKMWQDYADANKGVCIEYTIPFFNPHYYSFKVNYDRDFLPIDLYDKDGREIEAVVQRWYFTKRLRYKIEDEVRVFFPDGSGIFPVDKRAFTGLFYGKDTSPNDIAELEQIVKNGGYSFSGQS